MLFLPIVENAFKHGISLRNKSEIFLNFTIDNDQIVFNAKNTMASLSQKHVPSGIGLENLRKRLNLLYPSRHQVLIKINYSNILFIEGSGNYLTFNTSTSKIVVLMNMNDALKQLPETTFVRIHKSFIVSLSHITIIENHQVQINTIKIPVGNYYRESFLNRINSSFLS